MEKIEYKRNKSSCESGANVRVNSNQEQENRMKQLEEEIERNSKMERKYNLIIVGLQLHGNKIVKIKKVVKDKTKVEVEVKKFGKFS